MALALTLALLCAAAASAAPAHAATPACGAAQLRLSADGDGDVNGMSHGGIQISIRNLGRACTLPARPALRFDDAKGQRIPVRIVQADGAGPGRVLVTGGHRAAMQLRWVSGPVYPHSRRARVARVGVRAGGVLLRAPLDATLFGAGGKPIEVRQTPLRAMEGMAADR